VSRTLEALFGQLRLSVRLMLDSRVPMRAKLIPMLAILYIVSPLDLIPDVFLVIGQLDDIGVLLLAMRWLESASPPEVVAEHRDAIEGKKKVDTIDATDYRVDSR
jgi:uncharacterized membrane protein YkvA (DUF1232 family)